MSSTASPAPTADRPAPAVLLLHGQPGSARDWTRVIDLLGRGTHSIAIDRPGWDGHTPPTGLDGNVRAAIAALDAEQVSRAVIVGHSLGGAVAARLAEAHPERVASLVLCAPAANTSSLYPLDRWLATPLGGHLASAAMAMLGLALSVPLVRRRLARLNGLEERYVRITGRRLLGPTAWAAFAAEQRSLIDELPALEADLWRITAPTTILAGSADRTVPMKAARRLAEQIAGAQLRVVRGAGHLLPQQYAPEIAAAIRGDSGPLVVARRGLNP